MDRKENCSNCEYWDAILKHPRPLNKDDKPFDKWGYCHRYPPIYANECMQEIPYDWWCCEGRLKIKTTENG